MAKKSAASKGYRKNVKRKPFLTKKEIIELIVIIVVIVLAVVAFNIFYDDGTIEASEVQSGDIVSYGSSKIKTRYFKVGEANELEGFTRTDSTSDSSAIISYSYTPDEETDNISEITLSGSIVEASQLVDNILDYEQSLGVEIADKVQTTIQGHDAYVIGYTYDYYSEDLAAETETDETVEAGEAEAAETAEAETAEVEATEAPDVTEEAAVESTVEPTEATDEESTEETTEETAEETTEEGEESEEQPSNVFGQVISVYVHVDDSHTLAMHITRNGDDDSFYMPQEDYLDYAMKYVDAFTVAEK